MIRLGKPMVVQQTTSQPTYDEFRVFTDLGTTFITRNPDVLALQSFHDLYMDNHGKLFV